MGPQAASKEDTLRGQREIVGATQRYVIWNPSQS